MDVKGSVIVVTGGGSGIGASVAKRLAKDGAKVAICGRRADVLDKVVGEIKAAGGEAIGVPTDITSEEAVGNLMDKTIEAFGRLDVVFANAGVIADGLFINTDKEGKVRRAMGTEQFKSVIDINLVGTFLSLRQVIISTAATRASTGGFGKSPA